MRLRAMILLTLACAGCPTKDRDTGPGPDTARDTDADADADADSDTDTDADADADADTDADADADTDADVDAPTIERSVLDATGIVSGLEGSNFNEVAGGGDVSGDGIDDLLFVDLFCPLASDRASVLLMEGPVTGEVSESEASAVISSTVSYYDPAEEISIPGDINGDGFADVAVGGSWGDPEWVFLGPISGSLDVSSATATLTPPTVHYTRYYPDEVRPAGDIDADGSDDILIESAGPEQWVVTSTVTGEAALEDVASTTLWIQNWEDAPCDWDIPYEVTGQSFGPGDLDGDGIADLVITDSWWRDGGEDAPCGNGMVYVLHGPMTEVST